MIEYCMFFFFKNIPKPVEHKIVYDYSKDMCRWQSYKYMYSPTSIENRCFSPHIRKRRKVNGNSYVNISLSHDTLRNWEIFGKNLVLTIDDSYDSLQTREMFELLERYNVTATFFPNTVYINPYNQEHKKLWQDIYNSGHEIGYHTTNHQKKKSVEELEVDFANFTQRFREILEDNNFSIKSVRAPYGYFDGVWMEWVIKNNLFNVRWTITENEDGNYLRELYSKGKGTVLLLHNKESDVKWLTDHIDELLKISKENGGKMGSIYDSISKKSYLVN